MAAVCGFEVFINGKHIVGEVKEKEQAHKEYRGHQSGTWSILDGRGDTMSVGDLPPGASVLIKITDVAELLVEGEFSLPGSVAPWKKDAALDTTTQVFLFVSYYRLVVTEIIISYLKEFLKSKTVTPDDNNFDHQKFNKALEFSKLVNRRHPSLYKQLELGRNQEDAIKKIVWLFVFYKYL